MKWFFEMIGDCAYKPQARESVSPLRRKHFGLIVSRNSCTYPTRAAGSGNTRSSSKLLRPPIGAILSWADSDTLESYALMRRTC